MGAASAQRTVLRSATDLMLDAMAPNLTRRSEPAPASWLTRRPNERPRLFCRRPAQPNRGVHRRFISLMTAPTMREVIKIAFRRESINVVHVRRCRVRAGRSFDENPPDVVITDVIMPDQDGYSVCSQGEAESAVSRRRR